MTQVTAEQQEQMEALAERTAAKLKGFYGALAADEQAALGAVLWQAAHGSDGQGAEQTDDAQGYAGPATGVILGFFAVYFATKVLDDTGLGSKVVSDVTWVWNGGKPPR
jgi:hypothetical protein